MLFLAELGFMCHSFFSPGKIKLFAFHLFVVYRALCRYRLLCTYLLKHNFVCLRCTINWFPRDGGTVRRQPKNNFSINTPKHDLGRRTIIQKQFASLGHNFCKSRKSPRATSVTFGAKNRKNSLLHVLCYSH